MVRIFLGALALTVSAAAAAQSAPPVSPEKQALVQRVLDKMSMDNVGLAMLQAPVAESLRQARAVLQGRVAADKQEAALKDIGAEANKFFEKEAPVVRRSTQAVIAANIAPLLAQRFTDDELKQLVALLESPVKAKFDALLPEIQKTVGQNVAKANQVEVNAGLTDLQQRIGLRLRSAIAP